VEKIDLNKKGHASTVMWNQTHPNIRVHIETKKALDQIGKKGDTYDDVVRRLIEFWEKQKRSSPEEER